MELNEIDRNKLNNSKLYPPVLYSFNGEALPHSESPLEDKDDSLNSSSIIKWLLGIFAGVLSIGVIALLGRLDSMDRRIGTNEIAIAGFKEILRQVDDLAKVTRSEQVERTFKINDINMKINNVEQSFKQMELMIKQVDDRYRTISDRILIINNRLDTFVKRDEVPIRKKGGGSNGGEEE